MDNIPATPNEMYSTKKTDFTALLNMLLNRMDNIDKKAV